MEELIGSVRRVAGELEGMLSDPELPAENYAMAKGRIEEAIFHLEMAIVRAQRGARPVPETPQ